jgi:thymidylate synthase (FAD)
MADTDIDALPVVDSDAPEVTFRSDVAVELVRASAQDADVLFAARVSTQGEQSLAHVGADPQRSKGLINYLMRDRHGCYDDQTEVLTEFGWVPWPQVSGDERFLTLSPDGRLEYQRALRRVRRRHAGPMLHVRTDHVDLLVTPDHRMYAARRRQPRRTRWELVRATDLLRASHRMAMSEGVWEPDSGLSFAPAWFSLLGFFIGGGHSSGSAPSFRLRTARAVEALHQWTGACGFGLAHDGADRYHLLADEDFRLFAKRCHTQPGPAKIIPPDVLGADRPSLEALFEGLMASDGSTAASGKQVYTTTSRVLAGQVQELALKIGRAATIHTRVDHDSSHLGSRPVHTVTIFQSRGLRPKIGWTPQRRADEVQVVHYEGEVHCVTVPNGTLYVRRNGKPIWSGNSPFEHNSMTFYVQAPIFVFREFMRHRIASYNEESGRYRELRPVFYVPGPDRRLRQVGKPGAYEFHEGTPEQTDLVQAETKRVCREAYAAYQRMLDAGIAREVARIVLPVTIYSSMYVTMNARSLMNFLSLRTAREGARFPSFPQREIEMCAERMEQLWAELMPLTHAAFEANGRVAP